jgi:hypothetical protein
MMTGYEFIIDGHIHETGLRVDLPTSAHESCRVLCRPGADEDGIIGAHPAHIVSFFSALLHMFTVTWIFVSKGLIHHHLF